MNSTETRIFDTAPLYNSSNDASMPSGYSVHSVPYERCTSTNMGARETTRQQWEDLKPLIEQIYIKENKPFNYLAEILGRNYGFEPTKRQFSRKIIKWGFRKNVPRSERRLVLEQLPRDPGGNMPNFKDYRLKPAKLNNWRRRYRAEVRIRSCPSSQRESICRETPNIVGCEAVVGGGKINHLNIEVSMTKNAHHLDTARETGSIGISFLDMRQNGVPFEWSKIEFTGFPELLPLSNSLRSEWAAPDQPLPLDETEFDAQTCLSNSELQMISNNGHNVETSELYTCLSIRTRSMAAIKHRTKFSSPCYPWRDVQNVFCGHSTSPLNEIYVFPPYQESLQSRKPGAENLWCSLNAEVSEFEMKLFKLEVQFGRNNSAVIAVMERLGALYHRLDCNRKSELMRRRLVDVYCRILGPIHRRTLRAGLAVVESLLSQGEFVKAQDENHALRSSILTFFEHDDPLTTSVNYLYGRICNVHGRTEEAEKHFRQRLQIMLSLHGPKAMETVRAMSSLGNAIVRRRPKEADILLRIAAQLAIELPRVDEGPCRLLKVVVDKLFNRRVYEESYSLATKSIEWFSLPLGDEHPAIWETRDRLAWNMSAMGNLQESVKIFRGVISHKEKKALDFDHFDAIPWCGLAKILLKMGEIEEATKWYEKAFEARLLFCGSSNDITLSTACRLGSCYTRQGKYDEALDFYKKIVNMLHDSGKGRKTISGFESHILHFQRKIAEGHR